MAPLGNTLLGAIVFFTRVGLSCETLATIAGIPFPKLWKKYLSLISNVFSLNRLFYTFQTFQSLFPSTITKLQTI